MITMYKLSNDIVNNVRRENCFDSLRYVFALFIIILHFNALTGHHYLYLPPGMIMLKGFFLLSGFWVTYSYIHIHCSLRSYTRKRIVRIFPAYAATIFFCLLTGACLSTLSFQDFFSDIQTWRYAVCNLLMLNWLQPDLPGVFAHNPLQAMNGALWTMKFECLLYAAVPFIVWLMSRIGRRLLPLAMLLCLPVYRFLPVQLEYLTYSLAGIAILLYFDFLIRRGSLLAYLSLASEVMLYTDIIPQLHDYLQAIEPLTLSWFIIYIGYSLRQIRIVSRIDNISYGIYLLHFPVIQVCVNYGLHTEHPYLCFVAICIVTTVLAWLSYRWIERPMIRHYR